VFNKNEKHYFIILVTLYEAVNVDRTYKKSSAAKKYASRIAAYEKTEIKAANSIVELWGC
jgi:hypothetical protein